MRFRPLLFAATTAEAKASVALIAATKPHEDKGDKIFAVAKLIKNTVKATTAAA